MRISMSGVVMQMGNSSRSTPCPYLPVDSQACCYRHAEESELLFCLKLGRGREEQCLVLALFS